MKASGAARVTSSSVTAAASGSEPRRRPRPARRRRAARGGKRRPAPSRRQGDEGARNARADALADEHDREHAEADGERDPVGRVQRPADGDDLVDRRACNGFDAQERGACERMMWPDMPARKPVMTGIERRSAIQPNLKSPATMRIAPYHQREDSPRRRRIGASRSRRGARFLRRRSG